MGFVGGVAGQEVNLRQDVALKIKELLAHVSSMEASLAQWDQVRVLEREGSMYGMTGPSEGADKDEGTAEPSQGIQDHETGTNDAASSLHESGVVTAVTEVVAFLIDSVIQDACESLGDNSVSVESQRDTSVSVPVPPGQAVSVSETDTEQTVQLAQGDGGVADHSDGGASSDDSSRPPTPSVDNGGGVSVHSDEGVSADDSKRPPSPMPASGDQWLGKMRDGFSQLKEDLERLHGLWHGCVEDQAAAHASEMYGKEIAWLACAEEMQAQLRLALQASHALDVHVAVIQERRMHQELQPLPSQEHRVHQEGAAECGAAGAADGTLQNPRPSSTARASSTAEGDADGELPARTDAGTPPSQCLRETPPSQSPTGRSAKDEEYIALSLARFASFMKRVAGSAPVLVEGSVEQRQQAMSALMPAEWEADATLLLTRALAMQQGLRGEGSEEVATIMINLGDILRVRGIPAEARRYFQEALAIREAALGAEHPDTERARKWLKKIK